MVDTPTIPLEQAIKESYEVKCPGRGIIDSNSALIDAVIADLDAPPQDDSFPTRTIPKIPPIGEWFPMASIFLDREPEYFVVGRYGEWDEAEVVAKSINDAPLTIENAALMSRRLSEARKIIAGMLLVLHDHSGTKKRIADEARGWLGLKPGAKVGNWYDKFEVKTGRTWHDHIASIAQ